jgi:hypothetical protein
LLKKLIQLIANLAFSRIRLFLEKFTPYALEIYLAGAAVAGADYPNRFVC